MRGYLLDVNHVSAWERGAPAFMAKLEKVPPETLVRVCAITLGEVECGLRITDTTDLEQRKKCRLFIDRELRKYTVEIASTTSQSYAEIMERIWRTHPPPHGRETEEHLRLNGVQVNDVWAVAVALERGLTFLTTDRMAVIREAVPDVTFENWLA